MSDLTPLSKAGRANLKERLATLAADKSNLQLVIHLMNRMSAVPGLENTVENMLKAVGEVIGGVNLILYYRLGQELCSADLGGARKRLPSLEDDLVKRAFETREPAEREQPFSDTRMLTPEFPKAYTWAAPLIVGPDVIGVLKMENLHVSLRDLSRQLPTFFSYAALVLKNEIASHLQQIERLRTEEELRRLNRALRTLSDCNQALIHVTKESGLLSTLCQIVVKTGGYQAVWVGYAEDDDARTVRPVARADFDAAHLATLKMTWADTAQGQGPAGRAIRTGQPCLLRAPGNGDAPTAALDELKRLGFAAALSLPLVASGKTLGVLTIYSGRPDAFDTAEIALLTELAGDLAFGIAVLRMRKAHAQAEDALRSSESNLKKAQRLAQFGHWDWDAATDTITWSEEYYRLYGFDPAQRPPGYEAHLKAYTPESAARLDAAVKRNLQTGDPYEIDLELARTEGTKGPRRWITARSETKRDAQGRIVGLRGTAQDITERKRMEEELQQHREHLGELVNQRTAELEHANLQLRELDRLKSMFIAAMSHELRTPLNSIIGFSSILHDEWLGPVNAEQKENLAAILRSGEHLLALINDVIDVSKVEAGKIDSLPEEFELQGVLNEAIGLVKKNLEEKGLGLTCTVSRQRMRTDRRRLLQCLLNLLSNAVKFTGRGRVTVEALLIPGSQPPVMEIAVTDTGVGIREEDQPKLFQPFIRLNSPLQAAPPGTGLGLYLAKKLAVEILKGEITLRSAAGQGSRFALRIPVRLP